MVKCFGVDFAKGDAEGQCTSEAKWRGVALNLVSFSFVVGTRGASWQQKRGGRKKAGRKVEEKTKSGK